MDMDDDEFGDLYTDVLRPLSSSVPSYSITNPSTNPPPLTGGDRTPLKNPSSDQPLEVLAPLTGEDPKDDWLPDNWNDDGDDAVPVANFKGKAEPGGLAEGDEARVSGSAGDEVKVNKDEGFRASEEATMEIRDLDREPVIPGLSTVPLASNGDLRISNADDWDSDSEDDLQIVLNDNSHVPIGGERNEDDDDEDGEEDLVIVTDDDQQHHHHPAMEEQDWGEGELQPAADGERKEVSDAVKANGAVGGVAGGRYSSHGFHPPHHSMFKYIRPGAAAPSAPVVGPPGQIRPPSTMGSIAGRGRGDWRPAGGRGIPGAPKSFHSGFGPGWGNNPSRAFGGGLDFTLPSHKTIFDIDIESFEEKPWRHPGVDITDYFNFGLDEDKWKAYCKQLDQLRLESTMQSKIRVYESGRSEQDYDPDLPPELAAAAGHHDISVDNMNHGKMDNGQSDLSGQGRGLPCIRAPFPPGRAIQVETGCGERLPSIDTRPPRTRDADAIIEIVLQDSMEDSIVYNNALEEPGKDMLGEELKGAHDADSDRHSESESYDRFPQTCNGHRREMGSRRTSHAPGGEGIMPPESPLHYNSISRLRSPIDPAGSFGTHRGGRLTEGASRGRYTSPSGNRSNDSIPTRSAQEKNHDYHQIEIRDSSMEPNRTSELSPSIAAETAGELSIEQKDDENDDMLVLGGSIEVEGEEETSDFRVSGETLADDSVIHSSKKQKLSSRVEQTAIRDNAAADDLRSTHSDNSRAKSGSSNQKRRESGDEEVQGGRSRRAGDLRRRHEEEDHTFRRKDDYGREGRHHEMDRKRMGSKGREAMYHSYPHRDWDSYPVHPVRGRSEGFERPRETDSSFRQRREEDTHGRRIKDEDIRRERNEEAGSRNRSKVRVSDRNDKDDDTHLKKRLDDGDWRGRNREGGPRPRERDDVSSRRDNLDDHQVKRKKDEEHSRRERTDKEDSSHGYRVKEESSWRKRDRDDNLDQRRREDSSRVRDKAEDHHSSKHKDESWRQREREDRQRLKHPHEDPLPHREREGRGATRSGRAIEDKPFDGSGRNKSDSKILISDKGYQHRDRRHHGEQPRRGERAGEETDSQHKGREDVLAREKHYSNEERSCRHERLSSYSDRAGASDNPQISCERHKEVTRKNKDTVGSAQMVLVKRNHEDRSAQLNEKVSSKHVNEQENGNPSLSNMVNQPPHSSEKQGEGDLASDEESQQDSKKGRSKLERWTSHKERDYSATDNVQSSSPRAKEVYGTTDDIVPTDELPRTEGNDVSDSDPRGADGGQTADRSGDDRDRHLDTVEKLKRRSERFKLPMPGEKDVALSKRPENDTQATQNEAPADSEVKPERPARKRRWTSSCWEDNNIYSFGENQ